MGVFFVTAGPVLEWLIVLFVLLSIMACVGWVLTPAGQRVSTANRPQGHIATIILYAVTAGISIAIFAMGLCIAFR
jgi:hypothetical protein